MNIPFFKYQGTGNDFILVDNREQNIFLNKEQIAFLCDRHFGIGADGLMLLENTPGYDFRMVYYNSDGGESTMCGNGGRCITAFARQLGVIKDVASFIAVDGPHQAIIDGQGSISLQMINVPDIYIQEDHTELNTGSPHYIQWVDDIAQTKVFEEGKRIRNSAPFQQEGINVNFVQKKAEGLAVRTYERGVEDETLSCGTGVTAAAIASAGTQTGEFIIPIITPGGTLQVKFTKTDPLSAKDVWLIGPASFVFSGTCSI